MPLRPTRGCEDVTQSPSVRSPTAGGAAAWRVRACRLSPSVRMHSASVKAPDKRARASVLFSNAHGSYANVPWPIVIDSKSAPVQRALNCLLNVLGRLSAACSTYGFAARLRRGGTIPVNFIMRPAGTLAGVRPTDGVLRPGVFGPMKTRGHGTGRAWWDRREAWRRECV